MIFDFIFLSKLTSGSSSYLKKEQEAETGFVSGYIIESIDNVFFKFFHDPLFFKSGKRFCLALQQQLFTEQTVETLDLFSEAVAPVLFSSSYFTVNGHPMIIILNSQNEDGPGFSQKSILNFLTEIFNYLGYDTFYYCFINSITGEIVNTNSTLNLSIYTTLINDGHDIKNWYLYLLEQNKVFQKLIFFFRPDLRSVTDVYSQLENAEIEFKKRNPRIFDLLEQEANLGKRFEQYEIGIYGLKRELESRDAYIANLNAPKTSLKKLSDFYYHEYEILPLWYKRFGHLIKVFMGKRSFRSLFDDKVKKYKD